MVKKNIHDSHITNQVRVLNERIYGFSILKDSILERAIAFFNHESTVDTQVQSYENKIEKVSSQLNTGKAAERAKTKNALISIERDLKDYQEDVKFIASERHKELQVICQEILELIEGENKEETLRKSAQILGTIQLISPTEGNNIAEVNTKNKPLYHAILSLLLFNDALLNGLIDDPHVNYFLTDTNLPLEKYYELKQHNPEAYQEFVDFVKIPVLMAGLLQDIGHYHPKAQRVLTGESGFEDPHRTLSAAERRDLLTISFRETVNYLVNGIKTRPYIGNLREEKKRFEINENKKLAFIQHLLKSSNNPQSGIGNVLRVSQLYTSIILSTKPNYNYKLLPKVFSVLDLNVERKICSAEYVTRLNKMMGMFPQGYGIVYIPKASDGKDMDLYEYAIVSQLYPDNPEQPRCRQATRNLTYLRYGNNLIIDKNSNLFFPETAKKLLKISKTRLLEILSLLASNYEERKELDVIPRCWHANSFFSVKENQNIWTKLL